MKITHRYFLRTSCSFLRFNILIHTYSLVTLPAHINQTFHHHHIHLSFTYLSFQFFQQKHCHYWLLFPYIVACPYKPPHNFSNIKLYFTKYSIWQKNNNNKSLMQNIQIRTVQCLYKYQWCRNSLNDSWHDNSTILFYFIYLLLRQMAARHTVIHNSNIHTTQLYKN